MADDLKVVVKAVLEADPEESAKRITSQLPSIANAVNQQSAIKVGVELDEAMVRSQAQSISGHLKKHLKLHKVGVEVEMKKGALGKLRSELSNIGVSKNMAFSMTKGLSKMGIEIDKVHGKWNGVEGKAAKILELTIQGTDAMGNTVTYMNKYDKAGNEVEQTLIGITNNLKAQRDEAERIARVQEKIKGDNIKYATDQKKALEDMRALYTGKTSAAGIKDDDNLSVLEARYSKLYDELNKIESEESELSARRKADIKTEMADLSRLVKTYQKNESVLRSQKKILSDNQAFVTEQRKELRRIQDTYTGKTSPKPITGTENLGHLITLYGDIDNTLTSILSQTGAVSASQEAWIRDQISGLSQLTKHYQNVEYAATQLRTKSVEQIQTESGAKLDKYEEELRSAGLLTDEFQKKIAELRRGLNENFTPVGFLDGFDALRSSVGVFQAQIKSADEFYKNLIRIDREIEKIEGELRSIDPAASMGEYVAQEKLLHDAQQRRKNLLREADSHKEVLPYSKGYAKYQEESATAALRAGKAQGILADKAREVDSAMKSVETTVSGIYARYNRLLAPADELTAKVRLLDTLMENVQNSSNDQAKVHAYERLSRVISECNAEIGQMAQNERLSYTNEQAAGYKALAKIKSELKEAGILTQNFSDDIQKLSAQLDKVSNAKEFSAWKQGFEALDTKAGAFQAQIKSADKLYAELARVEEKVVQLKIELNSIDPIADPELYAAKSNEHDNVANRKTALLDEAQQYAGVLPYVKKHEEYLIRSAAAATKLASAEAEVQAQARRINAEYDSMELSVKNVESAANNLLAPSDSLQQKMAKLREAADDVLGANTAQEKVNAWKRYQQTLSECNAELSRLQKAEKLKYSDSQSKQLNALIKYEEKLRSAGLLTDKFKSRIDLLFDTLNGATTKGGMTKFLDEFDALKSDVGTFEDDIKEIERLYKALADAEAEAVDLQIALSKIDPKAQPEKYATTTADLDVVNQRRSDLQEQILDSRELLQYSSQIAQIDERRAATQAKLRGSQADVADEALKIKNNIGLIETAVKNVESKFKNLMAPSESLVLNMQELRTAFEAIGRAESDEERVRAYERLKEVLADCNVEITQLGQIERGDLNAEKFTSQLEKASADLKTIERTWSAFKGDVGLSAEFRRLQDALKGIKHPTELKAWNAELNAFKANIKAAGLNMQSFADVVKSNLAKVTQWASATSILYDAFRMLKTGLEEVVAIDYAMIDLRKTTSETDLAYKEFYYSANDTAKQLGNTTEEVIAQTAEWSRLGYTMEQAAELAKNSAIFATISENMDMEYATDGLVSMLKAYDLDVNDTMDGIISKVNAVGNAYAVTNSDIVESLTRSSSALAVANTSFEESIALATAGTEITRNAEGVGNALKSISMRIRGYDEETEEYSEDIAVLTGAIADLTKTASNNYTGVSLFEEDDPNTYRSVYDILNDISLIWDEITDKEQADLLDTLFGKHRAQVGAAILDNFDQARKAMDTMANSAGSAEAEMANVTQSIDFQLNALKETWVGVAQNVFETDTVSAFITVLQGLSTVVQEVTGVLGTFGTIGMVGLAAWIPKFKSTVGRPKLTGFITVPTYALVVTRSELVA